MTDRETEGMLYSYGELVERSKMLREILRLIESGGDVHGQKWSELPEMPCVMAGSPVSSWYEACEKCREVLEAWERIICAIDRLRRELEREARYSPRSRGQCEILEGVYMKGCEFREYVRGRADERRQYRMRRELLSRAREYLSQTTGKVSKTA